MADEYGVTQPGEPEDYQQFMLRLFDLIADARDGEYASEGIALLLKARTIFIEEFERKYPGYGDGRAIWPMPA